jgi:beta-lactamase regulating signal transducer with metallopeptidase domain
MNLLNQSAFLKALGWSLLDSLWQMGLLWLVYVVLTANGRKLLSRQRHTIALLSLAGGSLWFLVTLVINFYKAAIGPEVITVVISGHDLSHMQPSPARWFEPALPWLSLAYLGAIGILFIRFYRQYRHTQRLFTEGLKRTDPEWRAFLQEVAGRLGIKKKVQIWLSSVIDTPVTLGFLKPVILLPIAAVNHLSLPQAEAIILHELNHIRRNDYLVNLLIACVDVLFFFNPFSKLLTATIRKEREHCCDDLVLQFRYDAQAYARALLNLEQNRASTGALVVAATGKDKQLLLNRVKRILGKEPVCTPVNHKLVAYLLIALMIGFIGWYNPGKVIVKKIETARAQAANTEVNYAFATQTTEGIQAPEVPAVPRPKLTPDICAPQKPEPVRKDPFEKLEQLIELTTDARLAALDNDMENMTTQMVTFVDNAEPINFSVPDIQTHVVVTTSPAPALFPYVPGNSFLYQPMEDTTLPKKYVMTAGDQKAKEAMEKALKALKQINWQKLGSDLKAQGQKLDMAKVQRELEKAMQEMDWSKINAEVQQANDMTDELVKQGDDYIVLLNHYQKERSMRQEKLKQAQQQILMDRLEHHEHLKKMEEDRKKECDKRAIKKKKIVQI